jgi:hypothetical protein
MDFDEAEAGEVRKGESMQYAQIGAEGGDNWVCSNGGEFYKLFDALRVFHLPLPSRAGYNKEL